MKGKRIIALLLVHLYLLTVVVPTACALSCPCIGKVHRAPAESCICHGQAGHQHLNGADDCGHNHDTQVELYTFDRSENDPSLRIAGHLADARPADGTLRIRPVHRRGLRIPTPPDPCRCGVCADPSALRAPPVQA